ncbi:MAG: hypothetical protein JRH11_06715 [Deltaproteobacteria bacterium]|nr:hypothetical protein [Deltaproteobacteria bacterium]
MNWILEDRRSRRSTDRYIALRYQLEHTRGQGGLEALVLADEEGLVVASSGDATVCAELGAVAPLLGSTFLGRSMPPLLRGAEVAVRPVAVYGQNLFLASVGGGVARDAHMSTTKSGVERILVCN